VYRLREKLSLATYSIYVLSQKLIVDTKLQEFGEQNGTTIYRWRPSLNVWIWL
jgi:hypothetical protein